MADLDFSSQINGVKALSDALRAADSRSADKIEAKAMRETARAYQKDVKAVTPKSQKGSSGIKSGRLQRSIVVKRSKYNTKRKNGVIGMYVKQNQGKNRADVKGAWYGFFVERGYSPKSKKVSDAEALRSGLVTRAQHEENRRRSRERGRRGGQTYRQKIHANVSGKLFMEQTFNANKERYAQMIIDKTEQAMRETLAQSGLSVGG